MPLQQGIANPGGAFGLPLAGTTVGGAVVMTDDVVVIELVNNSGAVRNYGDVVICDVTGLLANTTVTANDVRVFGVVSQYNQPNTAIPAGQTMLVQIRGIARVNIGTNVPAANDPLTTFTTAGQAATNAAAITVANAASTFAIALEAAAAKDTNNTIRCKLCLGI